MLCFYALLIIVDMVAVFWNINCSEASRSLIIAAFTGDARPWKFRLMPTGRGFYPGQPKQELGGLDNLGK